LMIVDEPHKFATANKILRSLRLNISFDMGRLLIMILKIWSIN